MKLLVVEDEERVASFLEKGLRAHGYTVEWVQKGQDALRRLMHPGISLVILDLGLPDLDGLDVLEGLRQRGSAVPVLVLSARGRVDDRVTGLNLGADDYLGKPFAFEELLARIQSLVRRRHNVRKPVITLGEIAIDTAARTVTRGGREVELAAREYSLLEFLALRGGQVVSRSEIESHLYDEQADLMSNVIDAAVYALRKKIDEPDKPSLIQTRRGMGYMLQQPGASPAPAQAAVTSIGAGSAAAKGTAEA